jgi:hypothetical protein
MKRFGLFSVIVAVWFTGVVYCHAQFGAGFVPARNVEEKESPLLVRVYEVGDLAMAEPSPYPATRLGDLGDVRSLFSDKSEPLDSMLAALGGGMGQGARPVTGAGGGTLPRPNDELIDAITGAVTPTVWSNVGGPSSIRSVGDLLVVSASEQTHAEIRTLIGKIRDQVHSRKTVVVETHWLWLTEEQLHRLTPELAGAVDQKTWGEHQKERELTPGYHATIACLNGQTVSIVAGRQRRFVISLVPVVGDDGAPAAVAAGRSVGYQPQSATVQEGAALQVRPLLCGDDQVIVDLHGRVVEVETPDEGQNIPPEKARKKTYDGGTGINALAEAVDRPIVNTSRIDTTFRSPLGVRTLVGGITGAAAPEPDVPSLYLFAKVTVREKAKETPKK